MLNLVSNLLYCLVTAGVLFAFVHHYDLPKFLPLKDIYIHEMDSRHAELKHITRDQLEQVVRNAVHGNFLSVDLVAVRDAFIGIPWVRDAKVERVWPQALMIRMEEHQALAHWGNHAMVNIQGEVFRAVLNENLPVFTGPRESDSQEMARRYYQFNRILAPVQQSIAAVNLSSRHAWRIRLETGTIIKLGRDEIDKRLARYVSVFNQSIAHLNREAPLAYVDLRYPNGFAVQIPRAKQSVKGSNTERSES